jgi:UDP-N-acetylmuramate dehydrogenase
MRTAYAEAIPLSKLTSFRIGGAAERMAFPDSPAAVRDELCRAAEGGLRVRALGGGKNLLVDDRGVAGLVLALTGLRAMEFRGDVLLAGAGVPIATLIQRAARQRLGGLEVLSGIPGTLGGAVRMNAGGAFGSIGDRVLFVRGFTSGGEEFLRDHGACGFVYRGSLLGGTFVTEVALRLEPGAEDVGGRAREILSKKSATQPLSAATAGCVFKNPEDPLGRSAGYLLDRAGMKDVACGGARVSPRHANFIENRGGAAFDDVITLLAEGRRRVLDLFGIRLCLEMEVWPREDGGALFPAYGMA